MSDVSRILLRIEAGDLQAAEQLLPLVYDELRRLARRKLASERPGQTLDATALVHEAYLRLVKRPGDADLSAADVDAAGQQPPWESAGHFFAAAARAMRRILVENARRKLRLRHGGGQARVELADLPQPEEEERLCALDEALTRLALEDALAAQVLELHHFAGLSHDGVAAALGLTVYAARQKWTYARAWLLCELAPE